MERNDYNYDFKMKVSRSLTDLQNSLDEACKLGLPPNLGEQIHDGNETYLLEGLGYRNDLTYKSASSNLERFIASHENQFGPYSGSQQQVNNSMIGHRQTYIDTLRLLAAPSGDGRVMPRSRSHDALHQIRSRPLKSPREPLVDDTKHAEKDDLDQIRAQLAQMDEEMRQIRADVVAQPDAAGLMPPTSDLRSLLGSDALKNDYPLVEEMRRKLDVMRTREADLINQLNEVMATAEQAKLEEMQAVLKAQQTREECENLKARFKTIVDENERKLQQRHLEDESSLRDLFAQLNRELIDLKMELEIKASSLLSAEYDLKRSKGEVEQLHRDMDALQSEKCRMGDDLSVSVTKAVMQRDEALVQMHRLQSLLDRERCNHSQERSMVQDEINELRVRLSTAEQAHMEASKDRIRLLNHNNELQSQLARTTDHLQRQLQSLTHQSEEAARAKDHRIDKLNAQLANKQTHFQEMITDAETLLRDQMVVINRFRHEFGCNVHDLDGFIDRHRDEINTIQTRLDRCQNELQESHDLNGRLQHTVDEQCATMEALKDRMRHGDERCDRQDQEIISLLQRQNELMKVVESLTVRIQEGWRRSADCTCGACDMDDLMIDGPQLNQIVVGGTRLDSSNK